MEITATTIWLISLVTSIGTFCGVMALAFGLVLIVHVVYCLCEERRFSRSTKAVAAAFAILALLSGAIPSKRDVAAMYIIPALAKNQDIMQLPAELVKFLRVYIETKEDK